MKPTLVACSNLLRATIPSCFAAKIHNYSPRQLNPSDDERRLRLGSFSHSVGNSLACPRTVEWDAVRKGRIVLEQPGPETLPRRLKRDRECVPAPDCIRLNHKTHFRRARA